ncbi:MAG: carbohydrate porin, partial [Planctomycetota bacterium]|nr:carbohydrate porin [Planctomycetota bacterium]
LWPLPNQNDTAITGFLYLQALNERWSVGAGKLNVLDFWTMVYPNVGRGVDGFMNLNSMAAGLPWLRFVNLSVNAGGVLSMKEKQIEGGFLVFDLNNSTTTAGLDNLFDDGAGVLGLWRFFTDWNGKPGSHLFAGSYANRAYTSLDENSWFIVPGQGVVAGQETGAWALGYYFQQVVWADPCNEARKMQLWTGWGLSDGNPSFARWNGFISLESYGTFQCREKDRAGVAYFYTGLSDDFRQLVSPVVQLEAVQGVELYYNYEVTPWFHLTGDLQFVENGRETDDTAIILGLRGKIDL